MTQFTQDARNTETSSQHAGLLAIERGEDDGMIVHQSASLNVHNNKDLNAITTR